MRRAFLFALLCGCAPLVGQRPEFEFYQEFQSVFSPRARADNPLATNDEILNGYARSLRSEGVEETEIARRIHLLREERPLLDADRYNRIYTSGNAPFNRAPNAFVMESLRGKRPGVVLDYAMGEGRNSIYLAQLGWEVWGFDPADAAVELAQRRARALGLTLHAEAVADSEFEFGHERFDVIVFSWAMPLIPVETVLGSLKPGGVVVMEAAADYVGRNGMLQMFDALRILKYEIVRDTADWYDRRQTEIVRLIAVKP